MSTFEQVRDIILQTLPATKLPTPLIREALPEDPCDVTDADEIRINCPAAGDMDSRAHAYHVFGHWLCDLHGAESYENPTRPGFEGVSDKVADFIGGLLDCAWGDGMI